MCENNEKQHTEVKESGFARAASRWSWIPGLGLILFFVFTPLALLQLGKGRSGFYLVRRAFLKIVLLSVLPIILLLMWDGFLKTGVFTEKFLDGSYSIEHYFLGMHFKDINYYKNGVKVSEVYYGVNRNTILTFYKSGKKEREYYRDKTGKQINGSTSWYESGEIESVSKNNKMISYFKNGKKEKEVWFNDYHEVIKENSWYNNGNIKHELEYDNKNNKIKDVEYSPDGKVILPVSNNIYKSYHNNGNVKEKGNILNNQRDGKWIELYDDGSVKYVQYYRMGKLYGKKIGYHKNGRVSFSGFYYNGKLFGKSYSYNIDSSLSIEGDNFNDYPIGAKYFYYAKKQIDRILLYDKKGHKSDEHNFSEESTIYFENGKPKSEEKFSGIDFYEIRYFNNNGNINKIEKYDEYGDVISVEQISPAIKIDWKTYLNKYEVTKEDYLNMLKEKNINLTKKELDEMFSNTVVKPNDEKQPENEKTLEPEPNPFETPE